MDFFPKALPNLISITHPHLEILRFAKSRDCKITTSPTVVKSTLLPVFQDI